MGNPFGPKAAGQPAILKPMIWQPDVTVAAVVEREGRFLVVEERVGARLVFNQPAGHLENGESLIEAVVRETMEETAWLFVPESVVGVYLWNQSPGSADCPGRSFLRVAFRGEVVHHDANRPLDDGIERAVWLTRQQLDAQAARLRSPLVMRCIDDFLAGHRYPLDLLAHLVESPIATDTALTSQTG
jgi:8-oxo-dGTP pyrophosphatase MutT (NUDIX family)